VISFSWVASRLRERRHRLGAALAIALGLLAAASYADGGEALEGEPARAPAMRVLESRWRRPEGCEPTPAVTIREDGARVLSAQSEPSACRVHGDADAHVRTWLESISIEVDARARRRPRSYPGR
jgi:hypothetical protein